MNRKRIAVVKRLLVVVAVASYLSAAYFYECDRRQSIEHLKRDLWAHIRKIKVESESPKPVNIRSRIRLLELRHASEDFTEWEILAGKLNVDK